MKDHRVRTMIDAMMVLILNATAVDVSQSVLDAGLIMIGGVFQTALLLKLEVQLMYENACMYTSSASGRACG